MRVGVGGSGPSDSPKRTVMDAVREPYGSDYRGIGVTNAREVVVEGLPGLDDVDRYFDGGGESTTQANPSRMGIHHGIIYLISSPS